MADDGLSVIDDGEFMIGDFKIGFELIDIIEEIIFLDFELILLVIFIIIIIMMYLLFLFV